MKTNVIIRRLKELRLQKNLTQKELAEKLKVNPRYIMQVENSFRSPSLKLLKQISDFFSVDISYFISERISLDRGNLISLPVVGRVYAGKPILAQQNIEDYISLPKEVVKDGSFILRVSGDSMVDARIFNGDSIIVRQQPTAVDGDIVVALIGDDIKYKDLSIKSDGKCVLRRFYKRKDYIELRAENSKMDCKPIKARNVVILGKVIGRFGGVV